MKSQSNPNSNSFGRTDEDTQPDNLKPLVQVKRVNSTHMLLDQLGT